MTKTYKSKAKGKAKPKRKSNPLRLYTQPFPAVANYRFKYCHNFTIDPLIGNAGVHFFYANSIFKPDKTVGTADQPLLYDEVAILWDHYKVIHSACKATFYSSSSTPTISNGKVGVMLTDDVSIAVSDPRQIQEQPGNRWTDIAGSSGSKSIATVKRSYGAKKFFGKDRLGSDAIGAQIGANPTDGAYFGVVYMPVNVAENLQVINVNVEIMYYVQLSERKQIVGS